MEIILDNSKIEAYLSSVLGQVVDVDAVSLLGAETKDDVKKFGYGIPILVDYSTRDGKKHKGVISTPRMTKGFGHDYRADRAAGQILAYDSWNNLPNHVQVKDLGAFTTDGSLVSLGSVDEMFLLRDLAEGTEYYKILDNMLIPNAQTELGLLSGKEDNEKLARALARYLAKIHAKKYEMPEIYVRRIRDTVGSGECVFGLSDSYPMGMDFLKRGELEAIEKLCVEHRWKLREKTNRLSVVHGDFHPWNIIITGPTDFILLDRSRGEYGEPADDVTALSINYLFYSLRKYGKLGFEFEEMFIAFMNEYESKAKDSDLQYVMPLFYTFRCLVIASPVWYPDLSSEVRRKIFNFARTILEDGKVDADRINEYLLG